MAKKKDVPYELIDSDQALKAFARRHEEHGWMCFDTEFVGEKRFATQLCLIQASTSRGHVIIDPLSISDLSPFMDLIVDPSLVKITHAGDNDYRLFYETFGVVPRNVFDTQIGAGFVGYRYPVSLQALVRGELRLNMKKGYTVADWESRPLPKKLIGYALDDILPLPDIWKSLDAKLRKRGRRLWADQECKLLESEAYYARDPHEEALNSRLMPSLKPQGQAFLLRLYAWRRKLAEEKDYSKNMVLPNKVITQIVRTIPAGAEALRENRRVPKKLARRHGDAFERMYRDEITEEEKKILRRIPSPERENPEESIIMEMLYLVVKYKCLENGISENLAFPRSVLKALRSDPAQVDELLETNWRSDFLGPTLVRWLRHFNELRLDVEGQDIRLYLADSPA